MRYSRRDSGRSNLQREGAPVNGKRKFIMAMYFGTACFLLCWLHCMNGGETVTVVSLLSAFYKASNVIDKKLGGAG